MAEESFVILVHIAMQDRFFDFSSNPALFPDCRAASNQRPKNLGAATHMARTLYSSKRLDLDITINRHRTTSSINNDIRID